MTQTRSFFKYSLGLPGVLCLATVALMGLSLLSGTAATNLVGEQASDRDGVLLAEQLVAQKPVKDFSLAGTFKIRHSDGHRTEVPVEYSIHLAENGWESIYVARNTGAMGSERLVVIHEGQEPNKYELTQISLDGSRTNTLKLAGSEAAVSFAGTDFWLSDLGMEFLHWPQQRIVKDAKITMRLGRPCKILESTNPQPAGGTYARVVSWIDADSGSLIYAEAYDSERKRFKVFSLQHFKKINGRWQVRDMELRNDKADSRTHLEFNFEVE